MGALSVTMVSTLKKEEVDPSVILVARTISTSLKPSCPGGADPLDRADAASADVQILCKINALPYQYPTF
ncbi:hypothetical protein [Bosea vaviloviae]|uniref:Uncharacterized protein n=1 Tax=Bosea vaviloviae TaxID=1526658 RepID=A0A1D7U0Y3_9HYPH|nr:hypothetical protein [Bosea vaviloviae]AOO81026.1 hypothetical protein BHK69_11645 [Bosea vaviloviae]